ncbi:MAG: Eco57I restriction-modification methylase domain-containing protein [Flavobacteriales bacterium]
MYKHTSKLASYDFESQIDVNILGHIFENSLNEIESVNAEIEGGDFDKQKSKRKKDGVFYTPKYITKYIVENTIGKLCDQKKTELGFKEEEYFKGRKNRQKATITKLVTILDDYRDWLLQLTICDPACGSGAFLNQALDFLIKEHTYIDELKTKVLGGGLQFPDIENTILENNIFGVDLNEESVEIAKLSLWLRTAQPRRKLNDLSSNIKCGNSLIDSKAVAGDKAFNWEEQFPKIFEKGGFDVIIGNPPYVQHRNLIQFSEFFKTIYKVYTGTSDLSVYFYEKGLSILKEKGMFAFINTNKFFNSEYGEKLRDFLVNFDIVKILNFEQVSIFKGALVSSTINIIRKTQSENDTIYIEFKKENLEIESFETEILKRKRLVTKEYLRKNSWIFENKMIGNIIDKIKSKGKFLGEIEGVDIKRGITTGFDDAFVLQRSNSLNKDYSEISKKLLRGRDIGRYWLNDSDLNLLFIPWHFPLHDNSSISGASVIAEESMKEGYLQLYNHLSSFKKKLSLRNKKETGVRYEWYVLQRCAASYYELFDRDKIVWGLITGNWGFSLDTEKHYLTSSSFFLTSEKINLQLLLLLLNSSLYKFYFENVGELTAGGAYVLKKASVEKFVYPSKVSEKSTIAFLSKAIVFNGLNSEFKACIGKFKKYLHQIFKVEKLSKKLQNWHDLEFGEFIKELNKAIKANNKLLVKDGLEEIPTLTKKDEFEWLDLFEDNKQKAQALQTQINQTDAAIDAMVYELYGLTEDEIAIVENS